MVFFIFIIMHMYFIINSYLDPKYDNMFENGNYRRRRRMKRPYRTTPYSRPGTYFGPDYSRGVLGSHPTNFGSNPNVTPRFDHRFDTTNNNNYS